MEVGQVALIDIDSLFPLHPILERIPFNCDPYLEVPNDYCTKFSETDDFFTTH